MKKSKKQPTVARDVELLFEVGCFRYMPRLWQRFFNPDVANNSEHTFRVLWIALLLATQEGKGDHEKIVKMAMIHDIPESRTGDVDYLARQYVERDEDGGMADMVRGTSVEIDLMNLWEEYKKRESIEAKLVKDADTLDVEMEIVEMKERGHSLGPIKIKLRKDTVYKKLYTPAAQEFWKEIHSTNIHNWHLNARNRFSHGDWKKDTK